MEKLLQGSDIVILNRPQCRSNGHVQTERCVRHIPVSLGASREWSDADRQTQPLLATTESRHGASGTISSSWLTQLYYVLVVPRMNYVDISDDCLRRVLQFSEYRRAFIAFACVCWQFRKLVTRAVIDEWSLSSLGLQDASRSLAGARKVVRDERRANVVKRSHIFLPEESRLSYFWASDGAYYSGTVLLLNLRAKVLYTYAI